MVKLGGGQWTRSLLPWNSLRPTMKELISLLFMGWFFVAWAEGLGGPRNSALHTRFNRVDFMLMRPFPLSGMMREDSGNTDTRHEIKSFSFVDAVSAYKFPRPAFEKDSPNLYLCVPKKATFFRGNNGRITWYLHRRSPPLFTHKRGLITEVATTRIAEAPQTNKEGDFDYGSAYSAAHQSHIHTGSNLDRKCVDKVQI